MEVWFEILGELLKHATKEQYVYHHELNTGDVLVWDNRSTLHRETEFDSTCYRRGMQRTTVSWIGEQEAAPSL